MDIIKMENTRRAGGTVNMDDLLGQLDSLYLADMDATISSYRTYEEVSSETYNDYKNVCAKLEMIYYLGYLDADELDAIMKAAAEMRLKKLEALEHEENRS